jgi:hypothetical protein
MAREIARLQLPVLRVALNDSTFFSTRRHPVRRFINRIASLANAFDDFDSGPGAKFLLQVRKLVDEIVEGDFDQIELYAAKVAELERFIAEQTQGVVEQSGAAVATRPKESSCASSSATCCSLQGALAPLLRSSAYCRTSWPRSGPRRSSSRCGATAPIPTAPGATAGSASIW